VGAAAINAVTSARAKTEAEHAGRQREQQTFSDELCDQTAPARAERGAHAEFADARCRPREQEVRDICAGDEQHERDGAGEKIQCGRVSPTSCSCSGTTLALLELFVAGYACSSRAAIALISLCACSTLTASRSRATTR